MWYDKYSNISSGDLQPCLSGHHLLMYPSTFTLIFTHDHARANYTNALGYIIICIGSSADTIIGVVCECTNSQLTTVTILVNV